MKLKIREIKEYYCGTVFGFEFFIRTNQELKKKDLKVLDEYLKNFGKSSNF